MSKFTGEVKLSMTVLSKVKSFPLSSQLLDNDEHMKSRGISKEALDHFGYRTEWSAVDDVAAAYYLPVTDKDGDLTGYLKRSMLVPKKEAWSTVGSVSDSDQFVGQSNAQTGRKMVWVVEGFFDLASAWQVLVYKGMSPNVVSIVLGVNSTTGQFIANSEFLSRHKEVRVCFDNDEGGEEGVLSAAMSYPDILQVKLDRNDPNEYLQKGEADTLNKLLMWEARPYEIGSIFHGSVSIEELNRPLSKGIHLESMPKLMHMMRGLREREFTIIMGVPKSGKSSVAKLMHYELLKRGQKTLGIYLEEDLRKTCQSFVAMDNNVHLPVYREDPSILTDEQVQKTMDTILDPNISMFYDDKNGEITVDNVLKTLEWAYHLGCKYVILDHFTFVVSNSGASSKERQIIDELLNKIAGFVKKTGIHVIGVAHVTVSKDRGKVKDNEGEIEYPYWFNTETYDARGSGAFAQVAWNLIGIDSEIHEDSRRGRTRLRLLLSREWGVTGAADILTMNKQTGQLECEKPNTISSATEE